MPDWLLPVLTVIGMIFSAGITWGILTYRQKRSEDTQSSLVKDLRECVGKLQSVVTEVEVMKSANRRFEKEIEEQDKRIGVLELTVAKMSRTTTRRKG